jgi:hypothetical protein
MRRQSIRSQIRAASLEIAQLGHHSGFRRHFLFWPGYPSSASSIHATRNLSESRGYAYTDKEWKEYVRHYPFLDR